MAAGVRHRKKCGPADSELVVELLTAVKPEEDSRPPLLLRVPLAGGDLLSRTSGTWPRKRLCSPTRYRWTSGPPIR